MAELSYPSFPKRAFVAAGVVVLALAGAAVVVNEGGPSVRGCAVAAERVMAARDYSVDMMELIGSGQLPACHGLTAAEYRQALLDTYRIEYGGRLPKASARVGVPPPSYRTRSAEAALRSR